MSDDVMRTWVSPLISSPLIREMVSTASTLAREARLNGWRIKHFNLTEREADELWRYTGQRDTLRGVPVSVLEKGGRRTCLAE